MSAFALLIALFLHMPSYAGVPPQELANCFVDTFLVGDAMLLFRNAADSWKAETTLTCDSMVMDEKTHTLKPGWRFTKPITISIIGNTTDYQNVNEKVRLTMKISTGREPSSFELWRLPVTLNLIGNTLKSPEISVGNTKIEIAITAESASNNACLSLASGTLFLGNRTYQSADLTSFEMTETH